MFTAKKMKRALKNENKKSPNKSIIASKKVINQVK